ncbi:ribosomal protein S18-alanine N-acetyltransferase [uncultured Bifidobacterium sp.]|uniref:ribosomal protein S18-alanine N-acetyltransferase n=1 Tax=uncultured Bifidobacterium sp. TaxID=165187 RepID=UPI0028DCCA0F|nr:ribosomal protein S18-alanine N-acetyltransferase [uncultured Bifidobacterium sp.]
MIVAAEDFDRQTLSHALAGLESRCFGSDAWTCTTILEELAAPARTYIVDVDDAVPAGTSEAEASDRPEKIRGYAGFWFDGDDAELMTIAVDPRSRRQGLAGSMLRQLIDRARVLGARRMLLEVRVDNVPALALYHGFGFTRFGLRRRYYQPEGVDAYVMALGLAPRTAGFSPSQGDSTPEVPRRMSSDPPRGGGRDEGNDGSGIEG